MPQSSSHTLDNLTLDRMERAFNTTVERVGVRALTGVFDGAGDFVEPIPKKQKIDEAKARKELFDALVSDVALAHDVMRRGNAALSEATGCPGVILGVSAAALEFYGCHKEAQEMLNAVSNLPKETEEMPKMGFAAIREKSDASKEKSWVPSIQELRARFEKRKGKLSGIAQLIDFKELIAQVGVAADIMRRGEDAVTSKVALAPALARPAIFLKEYGFDAEARLVFQASKKLENSSEERPSSSGFVVEDASQLAIAAEQDFGDFIKRAVSSTRAGKGAGRE